MADSLTPEKRSWNMSKIKSRDTSIELKVRRFLFNKGFRYRVNVKNLPGKPDIVLRKYNTVIFIHGCFWHRHETVKMPRYRKQGRISGLRSSEKMSRMITGIHKCCWNRAGK